MKQCTWRLAFGLVTVLSACGGGSNPAGSASSASTASGNKFTCATQVCTLPAGLEHETLCCKDPFAGGCGIKSGTECRDIPKIDTRCPVPSVMIRAFPGTASETFGCCTDQNECGIDTGATMGPMGMTSGCRSRSSLCNSISKTDATSLNPQTCDGTAIPLPDNCGQTGGGFPGGPPGRGMPPGVPPAAAGSSAAGSGAVAGSGGS